MSDKIYASCNCGFSTSFHIGRGMIKPLFEMFPFYSENSSKIEFFPLKLWAKKSKSRKDSGDEMIPYDDPRVIGIEGKTIVSSPGILTDGTYKCPKCKEITLKFVKSAVMYD